MNIIEKLKGLGVEVTSEIEKAFPGEFISQAEHEKKVGKVEADRDKFKTDYETAKATLDGFEGKDFDAITKERDEWKKKADEAAEDYKKQIEQRDYTDAVNKAVEGIKFSSNSAKKAFVAELSSDPLKMKDGALLGFNDFVEAYKKNDESAFVTEEDGNAATFTEQMGNASHSEPITGDPSKMDFATYKKWREQNQ